MHLINTHTIKLQHFISDRDAEYVILSHRWEAEEVSFQEIQSSENLQWKNKKGYQKILNCCAEARRRAYNYAWIDTCCIDKTNSTDLSEAINSMFRWYQSSKECFAYLSDVNTYKPELWEQFYSSEWFERGWTLQELIAPENVYFFDVGWRVLGSKKSLVEQVNEACGIMRGALRGEDLQTFSIAERMHWAAHRKTTRLEDKAYSLMGLFNVNMPMLYGEGERAFLRLQQEIIQRSNDHSIFAWTGVSDQGSGLLAPGPQCFSKSLGLINNSQGKYDEDNLLTESEAAYTLSNLGLNITLALTPWTADIYLAILNCICLGGGRTGIFLRRVPDTDKQGRRVRDPRGNDIIFDTETLGNDLFREFSLRNIYVRQDGLDLSIVRTRDFGPPPIYGIMIISESSPDCTKYGSVTGYWRPENRIAGFYPGQYGELARFELHKIHWFFEEIRVGLTFDYRPVCLVQGSLAEKDSHDKHLDCYWYRGDLYSHVAGNERFNNIYDNNGSHMWHFMLGSTRNEASFNLRSTCDRSSEHQNRVGGNEEDLCEVRISSTIVDSRFVWTMNFKFTELDSDLVYLIGASTENDSYNQPFLSCFIEAFVQSSQIINHVYSTIFHRSLPLPELNLEQLLE